MRTLEHRIEALEQAATPRDSLTVIVLQLVSPGGQLQENRSCKIDGETHARRADESAEDFEARMAALAEDLNKSRGKPIQIMYIPKDAGP